MTVANPADLMPSEAIERFLDRHSAKAGEETIRFYRNRLERFREFCTDSKIDHIGELTPWLLDQYLDELGAATARDEIAPTTHKGHVVALNLLVEYLVGIDAVNEDLQQPIEIPRVDTTDEVSDKHLSTDAARELLRAYRRSTAWFGQPRHTVLELAWSTGARVGGLRALDLDDIDLNGRAVAFRHRPSTDTPLKNKQQGERDVGIPETVREVLSVYIERERPSGRDEHGREPLFTTQQGRASISSLRSWCYLGTQPCVAVACPHGESRQRCTYRERTHASKCPSSRSPHQVRSGSITWHLNSDIPLEIVAERVNASPQIIAKHYDVAGDRERLEERRRPYIDQLDIVNEDIETEESSSSSTLTANQGKIKGQDGDGGI